MTITITHNGTPVDIATLPESSVQALVNRGWNHIRGNEAASKVTSHFEGESPSDEEKAAYKAAVVDEFMARLVAGTMGVRASAGPRVTPLESVMRTLAIAEIKAVLTKNKLSLPAGSPKKEGDPTPTIVLNGQPFTKEQLIERRLTSHGDRLKAEAEKELKRRARELDRAGDVSQL